MACLKSLVLGGMASLLVLGGAQCVPAQDSPQKATDQKAATATQKPKMTPDQRFDALDTNKDGKLSPEEFKAPVVKRSEKADKKFKAMDKNGDGVITKDEVKGNVPKQLENADKRFKAMDKNGDGTVSKDEFTAKKKAKQ